MQICTEQQASISAMRSIHTLTRVRHNLEFEKKTQKYVGNANR